MTITKHGLKNPIPAEELYGVRSVYNDETGMSGTLFSTEWPMDTLAGIRFFLSTEHEDVGLVTWYEAPTYEEADQFLDRLKAVQVAKEDSDAKCAVPGYNHSEDLIEVSRGSQPVVMCGFHEAQKISSQAGLASFRPGL